MRALPGNQHERALVYIEIQVFLSFHAVHNSSNVTLKYRVVDRRTDDAIHHQHTVKIELDGDIQSATSSI